MMFIYFYRGIRDVSYLQVSGNDLATRHAYLLLAVRDLWFALLRRQHQVGFPGRYWKTSGAQGENDVKLNSIFYLAIVCVYSNSRWYIGSCMQTFKGYCGLQIIESMLYTEKCFICQLY